MNFLKRRKVQKPLVAILALLILLLAVTPPQLSAADCKKALIDCLIDAGITSLLGAIGGLFAGSIVGMLLGTASAGGTYIMFCLNGYHFCMKYVR